MYVNDSFFQSLKDDETYVLSVFVFDSLNLVAKRSITSKGKNLPSFLLKNLIPSYPPSHEIFVYHNSMRSKSLIRLPVTNLIIHSYVL